MLQAEIVRPDAVTARDVLAWRALAARTPAFRSPLLGPEFAQAVGEVRQDAAVALFRRADQLVGVLAHHRRPGGLARPIGAPWSDRHALITAPETPIDAREALAAAGLRAFRFSALMDPHGVFFRATAGSEAEAAYAIAPGETAAGADYWEVLRAASPKRFKNLRRLEHKLEREEGPVEFTFGDPSPTAFSALIDWKRDQFRRTGLHDVLHPAWSRGLMEHLFRASPHAHFRGALATLRARGRTIAAQFGVVGGGVYHPWLASYDPAFAAYSPGLLFISAMIRAMPELGLDRYELSGGGEHYKTAFASEAETLLSGEATVAEVAPKAARSALVMRLHRRFENIAQTEITLGGRLQGVAQALAAMPKRLPAATATPDTETAR